jgi:hypothetical protein
MLVVGSGFLAVTYWYAIVQLSRHSKRYALWGLWLVLVGVMYSRDALLLSYPFIVGLVCCYGQVRWSELSRRAARAEVAFLFAAFGLLPLIKGSLLVLCGLIGVIAIVLFARRRRWDLAIAAVGGSVVALIAFWLFAGQPLLALPSYVTSMLPLILGYAGGMSYPGDVHEVLWFLVAAAGLFAAVAWQPRVPGQSRAAVACVLAAFFFVAFKAGFVRHDAHALACSTSLLFAAAMLSGTLRSLIKLPAVLIAVVVALYIHRHYLDTSLAHVASNVRDTHTSSLDGLRQRLHGDELPRLFTDSMASLKRRAAVRVFPGTTDVYAQGQTDLIASGNIWNPRPVIQSYAAFNEDLAARNRDHLLGDTAPDNLLFRVESIDGRLPAGDDGLSWPALLTRYRPTGLESGYVVLRRRRDGDRRSQLTTLRRGTYLFDRGIEVPSSPAFVIAEIDVTPSLFGRLVALLYKPPEVWVRLKLAGGVVRAHRLIPSLGKAGILLSPYIESTHEFAMLYGGPHYLDALKVESLSVELAGHERWWSSHYRITFQALDIAADPGPFFPFDAALEPVADDRIVSAPCDGAIDSINDMRPPPPAFPADGMLVATGWLARSVSTGDVPDHVYLVLTDDTGHRTLYQTRRAKRLDVAEHFHVPRLEDTGYETALDISALDGKYAVGLAFDRGDRIAQCATISYGVTISRVRHP